MYIRILTVIISENFLCEHSEYEKILIPYFSLYLFSKCSVLLSQ